MSASRDDRAGATRGELGDALRALGVDQHVNPVGLRRAFHEAALRYHPDRAGPLAAERFREVLAAYRLLAERVGLGEHETSAQGTAPRPHPVDVTFVEDAPRSQPAPYCAAHRASQSSNRRRRPPAVEPLIPRGPDGRWTAARGRAGLDPRVEPLTTAPRVEPLLPDTPLDGRRSLLGDWLRGDRRGRRRRR